MLLLWQHFHIVDLCVSECSTDSFDVGNFMGIEAQIIELAN